MVRITFDPDTCHKLEGVGEAVDICDASGRVIGLFLPAGVKRGVPPVDLEIPLSPDEFARRRQARSGRTLGEILRRLDKP